MSELNNPIVFGAISLIFWLVVLGATPAATRIIDQKWDLSNRHVEAAVLFTYIGMMSFNILLFNLMFD